MRYVQAVGCAHTLLAFHRHVVLERLPHTGAGQMMAGVRTHQTLQVSSLTTHLCAAELWLYVSCHCCRELQQEHDKWRATIAELEATIRRDQEEAEKIPTALPEEVRGC